MQGQMMPMGGEKTSSLARLASLVTQSALKIVGRMRHDGLWLWRFITFKSHFTVPEILLVAPVIQTNPRDIEEAYKLLESLLHSWRYIVNLIPIVFWAHLHRFTVCIGGMPCGNGCAPGNALPAPSGNPPTMPNADGQMPMPATRLQQCLL